MSVCIYGAGKKGEELYEILTRYKNLKISPEYYVDKSKEGNCHGIPIVRLDDVRDLEVTIIIAINCFNIAQEVFLELKEKGFKDIWWFKEKKRYFGRDFYFEQCISCAAWQENMLEHMEMHVMDACNLNCIGCAHFSPIFEKTIPDFSARVEDIRKFKEKGIHPVQFNLLGGEPFLNPQLGEYARETRAILPETDIVIVTNGLLIPTTSDTVLQSIADNKVKVSISEYEPTHRIIEAICDKLDVFGIVYEIRSFTTKEKFNKPLSLCVAKTSERLCISDGCITLWNGKIARCPTLMYIDAFNEKFGTQLPNEGIMLLRDCPSGKELLDALKKEVPLCRHCVKNTIEWGVCGKNVKCEDFAI